MNDNIGFMAGADVYRLGLEADVALFFDAINLLVIPKCPGRRWSVITDRLYKRYVAEQDLPEAQELMNVAQDVLMREPAVQLARLQNAAMSSIDTTGPGTVADVFRSFFEKFGHAVDSAQSFNARWGEYVPLKIGHAGVPDFITDRDRPEESYDTLTGPPFWVSN